MKKNLDKNNKFINAAFEVLFLTKNSDDFIETIEVYFQQENQEQNNKDGDKDDDNEKKLEKKLEILIESFSDEEKRRARENFHKKVERLMSILEYGNENDEDDI